MTIPKYITTAELTFNFKGALTAAILKNRLHLLPAEAFSFEKGMVKYHRQFFIDTLALAQNERESLPWWPSTKDSRHALKDRIKAEIKEEAEYERNHSWRLNSYDFVMRLAALGVTDPYTLSPLGGLLAANSSSLPYLASRVTTEFGIDTPITPTLWKSYTMRLQYPFDTKPAALMILDKLLDEFRSKPILRPELEYDIIQMSQLVLRYFVSCEDMWLPELESQLFRATQDKNSLQNRANISDYDLSVIENRYSNALADAEARSAGIKRVIFAQAERIYRLHEPLRERDAFVRATIPLRFPTITPLLNLFEV